MDEVFNFRLLNKGESIDCPFCDRRFTKDEVITEFKTMDDCPCCNSIEEAFKKNEGDFIGVTRSFAWFSNIRDTRGDICE